MTSSQGRFDHVLGQYMANRHRMQSLLQREDGSLRDQFEEDLLLNIHRRNSLSVKDHTIESLYHSAYLFGGDGGGCDGGSYAGLFNVACLLV